MNTPKLPACLSVIVRLMEGHGLESAYSTGSSDSLATPATRFRPAALLLNKRDQEEHNPRSVHCAFGQRPQS